MEDVHCPICVEPMDFTDLATSLCSCNYKVCLWCYKRICEDEGSQARCPNCRQLYDPERLQKQQVDPVQLQDELSRQKSRTAESRRKAASSKPRRELANMRVVQRNLVYAVGLALDICYEETLRGPEFFGQFGKIVKISVSRAGPYGAVSAKNGPTGSAYVTFLRPDDARRCIECTHGTDWEGKAVKACYGTTKYCNAFLKGLICNNADCLYLHAEAADADSYTKEQTKSSKFVQLVHEASLQGPAARAAAAAAAAAQAPRSSGAIPIHASGSGSSLNGPLPDALVSALSSSPGGSSVWGSAPAHPTMLSAAAVVAAAAPTAHANGGTTWAAVAQTLSAAPSLSNAHSLGQQPARAAPPGPPSMDTTEDWPELPGASSSDALVNADKSIKTLSRNGSSMAAQLAGKPNGTASHPQRTSSQGLGTPSASTADASAAKQGTKLVPLKSGSQKALKREDSQERATTPPESTTSAPALSSSQSHTNKSSPSSVTSQSESEGGKPEAPALQTVQEGLQQSPESSRPENGLHANGHAAGLQALPNGVVDKEAGGVFSQRSSVQAPIGSEAVRPGKGGPPPGFGPPLASTANTPANTPSASGPWSSSASAAAQSPDATTHSLWSMLGLTTDGPATTPTAPRARSRFSFAQSDAPAESSPAGADISLLSQRLQALGASGRQHQQQPGKGEDVSPGALLLRQLQMGSPQGNSGVRGPSSGGPLNGASTGWLMNGIGGSGRAQSLAEAGGQDLQGHLPIYGSAPSARSPQQAHRGVQQQQQHGSNAWEPQEKGPQWQLDQHYKLPAAL